MVMDGIGGIYRVVAEFYVWLDDLVPTEKMKVKVVERCGCFVGNANPSILNRAAGSPDGDVGFGASVDEALNETLSKFMRIVKKQMPERGLTESDLCWSDPEEF